MNKVILMGRLTRDVEVKTTTKQNGESMVIVRYTIAVDRKGKDKETDFIPCVAFGKIGEFSEKYLHKGTKVVVTGRIQTGSYTNKDGQKVYTTDVVVEETEFAESKSNSSNPAPSKTDDNGFMAIPDNLEDEGLPF